MRPERLSEVANIILGIVVLGLFGLFIQTDPIDNIRLQQKCDSTTKVLKRTQNNYLLCKNHNEILAAEIENQMPFEDIIQPKIWKRK